MSGTVHVTEVAERVTMLEIDNPPMNPLGASMRAALIDAVDRAAEDPHVRCVILTGRGKAFCAGDDLKDTGSKGEDLASWGVLFDRLESLRVPVVGAINGWCVGGGFELSLTCDIRIASTEARFTCAGVNMGLMASAYRLPRLIGVSRAKSMLLTGLPHDAATAEHFGLVTALHEPGALQGAAIALASRIASRAPLSIEATKRIASMAGDHSPEAAAPLQAKELHVLRRSADHKEAVTAFREKRDPNFTRG